MKLSRLFQPRNPLFWIMLALNVLSTALAWLVHNRPLNTFGMVLIGSFALINAALGTWFAWLLVRDEPYVPPAKPVPVAEAD
jgi:ABC-type iron transport system FetAB permease component